jgi:GNAT superfamily N-acetyltransferase
MSSASVDWVIQHAKIEHAADLVLLMHELGYETSRDTLRMQLDYYDSSDRSTVFVALVDAKPIGLISGHLIPALHQPGNIGRITALIVSENYRSMGIASRLVEELEAWFLDNSCLRFEVTSGEHRDTAHRFYESRGYSPSTSRFLKIPPRNKG